MTIQRMNRFTGEWFNTDFKSFTEVKKHFIKSHNDGNTLEVEFISDNLFYVIFTIANEIDEIFVFRKTEK